MAVELTEEPQDPQGPEVTFNAIASVLCILAWVIALTEVYRPFRLGG